MIDHPRGYVQLCSVLMHMNSHLCCFHSQVSFYLNDLHEWVKGYYTNNEIMWLPYRNSAPPDWKHYCRLRWECLIKTAPNNVSIKFDWFHQDSIFFMLFRYKIMKKPPKNVEKYFLWLYFQMSVQQISK